jgi:hypothetical protein
MNIVDGNHLISWLVDAPVFAVLVDGKNYRWEPEHRWLADIKGAASWHEPLMGKRVENRMFYASDVRFRLVGFRASAVAVYVKKSTPQNSPVLVYADTMTNLPTQGKHGDVIVPFTHGVIHV